MEEMLKFRSSSGQALLVVVITMIVALTAGLTLASRTITNLKISKQNEDSQRAFQAASAGIEKYIQSSDSANTGQFTGATFSTNVQNVSGTAVVLNNGENVDQDRGIDVWLSDYPDYSDGMGASANTNISVCWALPEQVGNCGTGSGGSTTPALEILLLTGNPASPTFTKYAYDACGRSTNFTSPTLLSDSINDSILYVAAQKESDSSKSSSNSFIKDVSLAFNGFVNSAFSVTKLSQGLLASFSNVFMDLDNAKVHAQGTSISLGSNNVASSAGSGSSVTISRPTGVVANDVLIANVIVGGTTITAPSGWTQIRSGTASGNITARTYYKVATASEPNSYTWTIGFGMPYNGQIINTKNVSTSNPIDVSSITSESTFSGSHSFPAVTTTVADTYLLIFANGITQTIPYPASATWTSTTLNTNRNYGNSYNFYTTTYYRPNSTVGTAGPYSATTNTSMQGIITTIALRPLVTAPTSTPTRTPTPTSSARPNIYVSNLKTVLSGGSCADPAVTTFTVGQSFQLCGTVGNNGDAAANGYYYSGYRARTTQPPIGTLGDSNAGPLNLPVGFVVNNNTFLTATVSTTGCTSSGSDYICTAWVLVDRTGAFTETNETDNWASVNYTIATTSVPTLSAPTNSNPFENNVTITNNVVSAGSPSTLTARGTCYGTAPNPTNCVAASGTATTGSFDQNITGLTPNTLYYYRGFATNGTGTGYSTSGTFTTAPPPPAFTNPATTTVTAGLRNVQWTAPTGATHYYLRINDKSIPWNPGVDPLCDGASTTSPTQGNVCKDITGNTYSYNFQNGHTYDVWIHSGNAAGAYSNSTNITVTAGNPGPTPTPVTTAGATVLNCKYQSAPITLTSANPGILMKVIPLFNSTKIRVNSSNPLAPFPSQGKVIESIGASGDTKRKIVYYESYPQIPNEIFSYGILSQ